MPCHVGAFHIGTGPQTPFRLDRITIPLDGPLDTGWRRWQLLVCTVLSVDGGRSMIASMQLIPDLGLRASNRRPAEVIRQDLLAMT